MPCYYPRAHLHSSWTSPCPPPLPRPGPPFLITIPLKRLLLSENDHVPLSLVPLPFIWRTPQHLSLSPLPLLMPLITRAWASNWPPISSSLSLWVWAGGARGQRTDPHLPPPSSTFSQWNAWFLITVTQHWLLLTETPAAQDEWRTD